MSFDFTFSHFWLRFFDDFHYQALLGPILEGKSDQNEKRNFAKSGDLK